MMSPDTEITFKDKPKHAPLPERGILTAPDFDINLVRRCGPSGSQDQPSILGGMSTRLVLWPGAAFLAGPVLGAPMAVMALEELIRRGVRELIFVGSAGCLSDCLEIGSIVCPGKGLSTEGTSPHYPSPLEADGELRERIIAAGCQTGLMTRDQQEQVIWSTDGIYRETSTLIRAQRAAGATTVDMETTALFAAAAFRGVKMAAILVISDQIVEDDHHTGFHHRTFKEAVKAASELAWKVIGEV
ncbi:hypothetical protein C4J81_14455 [Deltaproteobacteria bacterium Smac51]|nr:hypothetical protein C4J81_14455 [Deltaproteobacteria bacterium Smac51]